ncbi:MAG: hypothetical protein QOG35_659 [Solirubrobacteraceae bacterium]|jgi:hypothetical protein|nr:hypothetical protein [Solirubrobacteraceae bacterium]
MRPRLVASACLALLLAGCGGSAKDGATPGAPSSPREQREIAAASAPRASDFPSAEGRSLQDIADAAGATGPEVGLATSTFVPGVNRLAFGLITRRSEFLYGATAVYVARDPGRSRARGPYLAPTDLLITQPAFRSQTAASEDSPFAAVYSARVRFDRPGTWSVLTVTRVGGRLLAAGVDVKVVPKSQDRIPQPGEPAPRVHTDTVASAGGNKAAIDTRRPFDDMHRVDLADAVGRKPVALLFATPALCQSRICGPVTDIAAQLESKYRDRMTFIHQEVYRDNDPNKGLRRPLQTFALMTEPWLFTIDARGRIAARLEGSFGFRDFEAAIRAALDR